MKRKLLLLLCSLMASLSGFGMTATTAHASPSDWCNDGTPSESEHVLTTYPVFTGVAVFAGASNPYVEVCYRTPTLPGVAGGAAGVMVVPSTSPTGGGVWGWCASDPGVQEPVNCNEWVGANAGPSAAFTGGDTLAVAIPFQVCAGPNGSPGCTGSSPNLGQTGLIVGALQQRPGPSGSTGAAYDLTSLQVWLNGGLVASQAPSVGGAFVQSSVPVYESLFVGPGGSTCTLAGCLGGALGLQGGTDTVTLVLPTGTQPVSVTIPQKCLVNFSGPC